MEVRIRLQKSSKGANRSTNYRIVAISRTVTRDGRRLEILGYYDPSKKPALLSVNKEKLDAWVKKGARMSDTIKSLVAKLK
ncbi:MAG: 30S ribosomal protein S16 [Candidatus Omnitrophota bacterium]